MRAKILLLCALGLTTLVALLGVLAETEPELALLFLILGLLLMAPAFLGAIRRTLDPLEPIVFCVPVFAYFYLVKPLLRILGGQPFRFGGTNLEWALGVVIIGLLAFYAGYYSRLPKAMANAVPLMDREVSSSHVRACAWLFILIGAWGLWEYMEVSGGWREFWSRPHGYGGRPELTTAYIYQLPELMMVGFFLIVFDTIKSGRIAFRSFGRVALASLGGVGVYSILWSRRTMVAWVLISLFTLWYVSRERRPQLSSFVVFGLVLFLAIGATLAYRPYLHLEAHPEDFARVDPLQSATKTVSWTGDEFDSLLAIVTLYPQPIDYDYFSIYGRIFIHPIPRLLWPDKPPLFVSSWDEFLYQSGISLGAAESVVGDFYIQMGVMGVCIGMFVSGFVFRFFYDYLMRSPSSGFMQLLYAVALGNVPSYFAQSAIAAFWKWLPLMVPGVIVAYWLARKRSPQPAAAPHGWRVTRTAA
jgi:hypothetical protein